jgi:hypothetical protein
MKKIIILSCVMLLLCSGCTLFQKYNLSSGPSEPKQEGLNQVFYGFPDVPTPQELNLISDRSFVYETSALKTGVLFLSGNVEIQSLENYFKINMPKNGWRYVNNIRYRNIILNYVKDDKMCNIRISKDTFSADVEIWVGPVEKGTFQRPNEAIIR